MNNLELIFKNFRIINKSFFGGYKGNWMFNFIVMYWREVGYVVDFFIGGWVVSRFKMFVCL